MGSKRVPGGAEWDLDTEHGKVFVFLPDGAPASPPTVVYVHGFFDSVSSAWTKDRLVEQFFASGVKAMFIAIETKQSNTDTIKWQSLSALLSSVALHTGVTPGDPVVTIGHSGAFENIAKWLIEPRLVHVTLLDALYGSSGAFRDWANRSGHTMTLLVTKTGAPKTNAEKILPTLFSLTCWAGVPDHYDEFSPAAKSAKTLYIVANEAHMQLVEGRPGKPVESWVIPVLLRKAVVAGLSPLLILGGAALLAAVVLK